MPLTEKAFKLYQHTLDFLRLRKRAYQFTFQNPTKNDVLKDLAKFCHANDVPVQTEHFALGVWHGRREVWLRIQNHLNLEPDELYAIYNKPSTLRQYQGVEND